MLLNQQCLTWDALTSGLMFILAVIIITVCQRIILKWAPAQRTNCYSNYTWGTLAAVSTAAIVSFIASYIILSEILDIIQMFFFEELHTLIVLNNCVK